MPRCKTRRNRRKQKIVHMDVLPDNLLISILSKMSFPSFTKCFYSTRWLSKFIQKNRKAINMQHEVDKLNVYATPDEIYVKRYPNKFSLNAEEELAALRPRHLVINGEYRNESRETHSLNPEQLPEMFVHLKRLGWLETKVELENMEEDHLLQAMDLILTHGNPSKVSIETNYDGRRWVYSQRISTHPLLTKVPSISLNGCSSPDLSFILSNSSTIQLECQHFNSISTINRLLKEMCDGTLETKGVDIVFDATTDPLPEILIGLPYSLIWSSKTKRRDDLEKEYPIFRRLARRGVRLYSISTKTKRVGGLIASGSDYGGFTFWMYDSEEEFIHDVGSNGNYSEGKFD